ncbi:MAG: NAD-dependent epimerase/dehydratase family protein, partial [Candidatus Eiseniibacteriota bacterium]
MDILILGGTRFLGRALAEAALERGDRVTLFHRGQSGAELLLRAEHIQGDREHDLGRLDGRRWDAVFDTCGFFPRMVTASARALAGRVPHYTFISSISVYAEPIRALSDESAPLATLADPATEAVTGETYGALKALCERAAESVMPGRVLSARAGLLVGPHDYTDRFPYWVARLKR